MAEYPHLREKLHAVFGLEAPAHTPSPGSHDPHGVLQAPLKPYFFRELWGCVNWFLLGDLAPALRRQVAQPFEDGGAGCPHLIALHIRLGDRVIIAPNDAAEEKRSMNDAEKWMTDKWRKNLRTPDDAPGIFFREADAMREREGWVRDETCYFVASDAPGMAEQAAAVLGPRAVLTTSGDPKHVAFNVDEQGKVKAVVDWILLSLADGVVHGMSTMSESALERGIGGQAESKCRPPQKRLAADSSAWYCLQPGMPPSQHAERQAERYYKLLPKAKRKPPLYPAFGQLKLKW